MVKQVLVKLTQWKDLSIMWETLKGESSQEVWRKYSNLFRCNPAKIQLSWLE
jgi:hypothetical protein